MAADFWDNVAGFEDGGSGAASPSATTQRPTALPTRLTSSQLDSKGERNQINDAMRASPQWRDAIKAFGLNPDGPLKLTKKQQQSLAEQLGLPTSDFHIDGAGNINDYHGWKGLPVAAKIALIAGAAAATGGLGGMFSGGPGAFGLGGAAGGGAGAGAGATTLASAALPTSLGTTASGVGLGLGGPAGYGALTGSMAAENALLGAPQLASLLGGSQLASHAAPGVFGMASQASAMAPNLASQAASQGGSGGFLHTLGGLIRRPGVMPQVAAGGFNLLQAKIAADSARSAALTQAQYGNRALDFEMQRYKDAQGNFQPFLQGGQTAFTNLSDILKTPRSYTSDLERLARGGQQ